MLLCSLTDSLLMESSADLRLSMQPLKLFTVIVFFVTLCVDTSVVYGKVLSCLMYCTWPLSGVYTAHDIVRHPSIGRVTTSSGVVESHDVVRHRASRHPALSYDVVRSVNTALYLPVSRPKLIKLPNVYIRIHTAPRYSPYLSDMAYGEAQYWTLMNLNAEARPHNFYNSDLWTKRIQMCSVKDARKWWSDGRRIGQGTNVDRRIDGYVRLANCAERW